MDKKYLLSNGKVKSVPKEYEQQFFKDLENAGLSAELLSGERQYKLSNGKTKTVPYEYEADFQNQLELNNLTATLIKEDNEIKETFIPGPTLPELEGQITQEQFTDEQWTKLRKTTRVNADIDRAQTQQVGFNEDVEIGDTQSSNMFQTRELHYGDFARGEDGNWEYVGKNYSDVPNDEIFFYKGVYDQLDKIESMDKKELMLTREFISRGDNGTNYYYDDFKQFQTGYDYDTETPKYSWHNKETNEWAKPSERKILDELSRSLKKNDDGEYILGDAEDDAVLNLNFDDYLNERTNMTVQIGKHEVDLSDKSLWESGANSFVNQLKNYFPEEDFQINQIPPFEMGFVRVTHNASGESETFMTDLTEEDAFRRQLKTTEIPFAGTKTHGDQKKYWQDRYIKKNASNLYKFMNKHMTPEEMAAPRNNLSSTIKEIELESKPGGELYVSEEEIKNARLEYQTQQYDKDGKPVLDRNGNPKMIKKGDLFKGWYQQTGAFYQPHSETLKQAEMHLLAEYSKFGIEKDESKMSSEEKKIWYDEIENLAYTILVNEVPFKMMDDKMNDYMNSKEGWFTSDQLDDIRAAYRVKTDADAKDVLAFEAKSNAKMKELQDRFGDNKNPKGELKELLELRAQLEDPDYIYEITPGSKYYEVNGKKIPQEVMNNYIMKEGIIKKASEDLNTWLDKEYKLIEGLEYTKYKADLAMRNYNDLEKFIHSGIINGFEDILMGTVLYTNKAGQYIVDEITGVGGEGEFGKRLDGYMVEYARMQNLERNRYQKDIKFGSDAFSSMTNLGKFLAQEFGTQIPIFASLALGGPGAYAVAASSGTQNYTRMLEEEILTGKKTSRHNKFWTSTGYGLAEYVFDRMLTQKLMSKSWSGMSKGSESMLKGGRRGAYDFFRNNWTAFPKGVGTEMAAEGFTTIFQNAITGRPITENLDHALFSGGMFGGVFGGAPLVKGTMMNMFSDSKSIIEFGENFNNIRRKQRKLDAYLSKPDADANSDYAKGLQQEIKELGQKNFDVIEAQEKRMNNISKEFAKQYLGYATTSAALKQRAKNIYKDKSLSKQERNDALKVLKDQWNQNQASMEIMRNSPEFGSAWIGFTNSNKKADKKRKEKLFEDAKKRLQNGESLFDISGKKIKDPTEDQINDEARKQYNLEKIQEDLARLKKDGKLDDSFKSYKTVEQAISELNKLKAMVSANKNLTEKEIADRVTAIDKTIAGINEGNYGGNMHFKFEDKSTDMFFEFQVEENMAKDDRLETRTHEKGHTVLTKAISENPEAFEQMAVELFAYLAKTNLPLFNKLRLRTNWGTENQMKTDEVIVTFFEIVAENPKMFESKKNKGLAPYIGFLFSNSSGVDFDFEGETDVVRFLTELAKKIKSGDVSPALQEVINRSKIAKEAREKAEGMTDEDAEAQSKASQKANAPVDFLVNNPSTGMAYTEREWQDEGANRAIDELKRKGYLNNLIAAKYKVRPVPKDWVSNVLNSPELANHIRSFNPQVNDSLFGWINSQLANKAGSVFNLLQRGKSPMGTQSLSAQMNDGAVVQVEDTTYDLDKITDSIDLFDKVVNKDKNEVKQRESTFRKEIGISNIGKSEVFTKVRTALLTSADFKNPKKFLNDFEQTSANSLYNTMERVFKNPSNLIKFRKAILESIPVSKLIQMQKQLPEKIFIKNHGRATNKTILSDFVYGRNESGKNPNKKKLLPEEILNDSDVSKRKRKQGVPVYERLDTTTDQWEKFINAPTVNPRTGKRSGTRGNNKIKVLSESAIAIAKDATPEVLNREFVEKYIDVKGLQGITPTEVVKEINEIINRPTNLKFSAKSTVSVDNLLNVNDIFSVEQNGKNFVLSMYNISDTFDLSDVKGRQEFKEHIKKRLLPLMPKDFWFGDVGFIKTDEIQKQLIFMGDKFYKQYGLDIKSAKPLIDKAIKNPGKKNINLKNVIRDLNIQHWGTAFTPSHKPYGVGKRKFSMKINSDGTLKNPKEARAYNEFRHELRDLRNLPDSSFGKAIDGLNDFTVSKYSSIFSNNDAIEKNKENGNIKKWNKKVSLIHSAMWNRFNEAIQKDKENARVVASYLGMVANDTNHWHKLGAQFIGHSQNVTGGRFEYEHAMPATAAYLYLLNSSLDQTINFDASYEALMENYKLIALDKAMDDKLRNARTKLNYSLQRRMPDDWSVIDGKWWERYFNDLVVGTDGVGIKPSSIIGLDGKNLAQTLGITASGNPKVIKNSSKIKIEQNLFEADKNSFKNSAKAKGMSTFDFDDTLGFTKSGVRGTVPNEDNEPKPNRKVIFLAGGAGSGKGNVVKKLGLENMGFKIVNQDISLEWLKKNSGLPADMRELTSEQRSILGKLGHQARGIAKRKMMKYQGNGNGVVIDGTGGSTKVMQKLVDEFKSKGYDVSMLFVDTSLDVALQRNKVRKERSLLDKIVKRNHEAVQGNKPDFKKMFGNRFMEVNTDNLTQEDAMPLPLVEAIDDFVVSYEKFRLDAAEFAEQGDNILERGGEFDFSEFNDVVDGSPGPLLNKARERAEKYGTKDMFVLTARPQASAQAIHEFLKSQGLNIPVKNITGLANSTGNAKAQWMLQKFAEGYNDMYFVDDAIQNVEAVKTVLNQLDIKSKVVQAKVKQSAKMNTGFNEMIQRKKGIDADVIISQAEARKRGKNIGRFRLYIPPSAEDFKGLMYYFLGKGKQGDTDMRFFEENLFKPFGKGIRAWNAYKQNMVNDYNQLRKAYPKVTKSLNKIVPGTVFTNDTAIRVYLWNKAGFEISGLNEDQKQKLIDHVNNSPDVKNFAEALSKITKRPEGYVAPDENWVMQSIPTDLRNIVDKVGRQEFLQEWVENKNILFSPENLNKIEAVYGTDFRAALENILFRMENGGNRRISSSKFVNGFTDWVNGSIGAIMFFNTRSALLQTMSTVNFINWSDNNIFAASAAFANQPQFWKDFTMLFNSDMLKQRRSGLQTDVSASELTKTFAENGYKPSTVINYLLQKGFLPTQIVDSFAIAFGGASMYRNRYNKYIKEGKSPKEAKDQAMLDWQEIAESTQQSSREDLISGQQASVLGRLVLAFQNVTMQYGRLTKKALSDLANGRGDAKTNVSKIIYYGFAQNVVFSALQTGLAFFLWGDDEEEIKDRTTRTLNQAFDSLLRGTGLYGAIVSTIKNTAIEWNTQKGKGWGKERIEKILLAAINLSPPIGSKLRKITNAYYADAWNEGVSEELGWRVENPKLSFAANLIEAATNVPAARLLNKSRNLEEAITGDHLMWQRVALSMGWNTWSVGVKDKELEEAKDKAEITNKEKRKEEKKKEKEEEKKKMEEEGFKTVRCSGIKSSGGRCSLTTMTKDKKWKCMHHMEFKDGMDRDGDGVKEYRCKGITNSGKRCKNKTENKNKKCYAHQ